MNHIYDIMNRKVFIILCIFVAGVFCACSKDDIDAKLLKEEQELAEYIMSEFPDAIDLGGGAFMVKGNDVEDAIVEAGDYILWNRKITNHITKKLEYTSDLTNNKFPDSYVKGGPEITRVLSSKIDEGLIKMRKGETGDIYIPSRYLICDFQPRVYHVEIVDVIKDLSVYQESLMYGYIRKLPYRTAKVDTIKNVVSTIDLTEYNVMYYIMERGTGDPVKEGMNVGTKTSISYMIQENEVHSYTSDQDYTWNTNRTGKIPTLTKSNCVGEIFLKEELQKGGKVVVTMPSRLFWDDKKLPKNGYDQYFIPKWSVVIFTITIK